jgi:quercetin dioxygenase-like cupin family protein
MTDPEVVKRLMKTPSMVHALRLTESSDSEESEESLSSEEYQSRLLEKSFKGVVPLVAMARQNNSHLQVALTGRQLQVSMMSVEPGEEIPPYSPQDDLFMLVVAGRATLEIGEGHTRHYATRGQAVLIPGGLESHIWNPSRNRYLQLIVMYGRPEFAQGYYQVLNPHTPQDRDAQLQGSVLRYFGGGGVGGGRGPTESS